MMSSTALGGDLSRVWSNARSSASPLASGRRRISKGDQVQGCATILLLGVSHAPEQRSSDSFGCKILRDLANPVQVQAPDPTATPFRSAGRGIIFIRVEDSADPGFGPSSANTWYSVLMRCWPSTIRHFIVAPSRSASPCPAGPSAAIG